MKILSAVLLALTLSKSAFAYELFKPTKVGIEGEKYDTLRDPYIPEDDKSWTYGSAMYMKLSLLGNRKEDWRFFLDPRLEFRGTESQIRYGALYYETGFEILKERGVRAFRRHHSQHVLEREREGRTFPLLDSWVVQFEWELK